MVLLIASLLLCIVPFSRQAFCDDNELSAGSNLHSKFLNYVEKHHGEDNSFLLSGLSLIDPLLMILMAAENETEYQLISVLKPFTIKGYEGVFIHSCNSEEHGGANYTVASRLYLTNKYRLNPEYGKDVHDIVVGTEVVNINFTNCTAAAARINRWVEKKTDGLIKSIIKTTDLDPRYRAISVNTILFQGQWSTSFEEENTESGTFRVNENTARTVSYMKRESFLYLGNSTALDAMLLKVPFRGRDSHMKIYFPNKNGLLWDMVKRISVGAWREPLYNLTYIALSLPKFEIETTVNLNKFLRSIGVKDIFGRKSNLPKLTETQEKVIINKFIQKTYLNLDEDGVGVKDVNEKGGTASVWAGKVPPPVEMIFSRPFYFEIVFNDIVLLGGIYRG